MTYTVNNGTWCKDNNKEYYSTTKTGLKAALAAGEITSGTKVVIHEPKYHAGQLIQSLNPECPEGCFVPHGQAFDTSIYTELAKLFPDGNLPDMRECVMVCAGENEHITTHEHDVFSAGEFKDDCAATGNHSHTITINDPGHGHTVTDPGHGHTVTDPGHGHGVSDTGHGHGVSDPGHGHGVSDPGHSHSVSGSTDGDVIKSGPAPINGGDRPDTRLIVAVGSIGISGSTNSRGTGISIDSHSTNISVNGNTTGISVNGSTTGISVNGNTTGISVNGSTTGITAECSQAGASGVKVTRTKQFGVYYYIAF